MNEAKQQASKHDWALFLTTDSHLGDDKMLEVYAQRLGIEVYFKEAKQKLEFFKRAKPPLQCLYCLNTSNKPQVLHATACQARTGRSKA